MKAKKRNNRRRPRKVEWTYVEGEGEVVFLVLSFVASNSLKNKCKTKQNIKHKKHKQRLKLKPNIKLED
jgi:hypothetical protein